MFNKKDRSVMLATIVTTTQHKGYPTTDPAFKNRFHDGYTEVVVSVTSKHSPFPPGKWRILVVNPIDGVFGPPEMHAVEGTFVKVPINTSVEAVTTSVGIAPHSGETEETGLITMQLWDGEESSQVVLVCAHESEVVQ